MDTRVKQLFSGIKDPRVDRTKKHPLDSILFIVLCGSLAGIDTWTGYEDYAAANEELLNRFIDLPEGVPSHDTISRVISALDVDTFHRCFHEFAEALSARAKGQIAIDGKTIRRSYDRKTGKRASHIVSAWAENCRVALAQIKTSEKSNEITAIPALLDFLDLEGQIVTIDAMGCQRTICEKILEKGGDYVISLKGNQGTLHTDVASYFESKGTPLTHSWEEWDKGHGRIEHRRCDVKDQIEWIQSHHKWPGLRSIAVVASSRETRQGQQKERRYYISSLAADAERIAKAARAHWGIENKLHWVLDVTFNEDGSRIRNENAPEIISMMRKWSMNIINQQKGKLSIKRMMNKIAMSPTLLLKVLSSI